MAAYSSTRVGTCPRVPHRRACGMSVASSSLGVYRNGILQKLSQDYPVSGQTIQFVTASTPQPGDTLLAGYRVDGDQVSSSQLYPSPQVLCAGSGSSITTAGLTSM